MPPKRKEPWGEWARRHRREIAGATLLAAGISIGTAAYFFRPQEQPIPARKREAEKDAIRQIDEAIRKGKIEAERKGVPHVVGILEYHDDPGCLLAALEASKQCPRASVLIEAHQDTIAEYEPLRQRLEGILPQYKRYKEALTRENLPRQKKQAMENYMSKLERVADQIPNSVYLAHILQEQNRPYMPMRSQKTNKKDFVKPNGDIDTAQILPTIRQIDRDIASSVQAQIGEKKDCVVVCGGQHWKILKSLSGCHVTFLDTLQRSAEETEAIRQLGEAASKKQAAGKLLTPDDEFDLDAWSRLNGYTTDPSITRIRNIPRLNYWEVEERYRESTKGR